MSRDSTKDGAYIRDLAKGTTQTLLTAHGSCDGSFTESTAPPGNVIEDDSLIVKYAAEKRIDRARQRIEVTIRRLEAA